MEFITKEDLKKIGEYAGQETMEHKHLELSKIYQKLEFLCQKIAEKGFKYEIRKDPRKMAGQGLFKFQEYQWARIYPPELFNACKGKFAYIVGLNNCLHFHMMGIKDYQNKEPSQKASNLAWNEIEIEDSGYEDVVNEFIAFEKNNKNLYIETGAALGIQECEKIIKSKEMKKIVDLLIYKKQIILQGPPGTGKTYTAKEIAYNMVFDEFISNDMDQKKVEMKLLEDSGRYKLIQFHPAYTYEDFVRGIIATTNTHDQIEYKVANKTLAQFAQTALDNPLANYVLIIDEINRANLPAVLGELIYALEYRYDEKNSGGTTVESIYALKANKDDMEGDRSLRLPSNLYIIGTMNTADRSVGHIDYAIRRRFAFVDILPDKSIISFPLAIEFFTEIENLFEKHTASDFEKDNVMLGHSYFLVDNNKDLRLKLKYEVLPILKEYFKDGVINKSEASMQLLKIISEMIEGINE